MVWRRALTSPSFNHYLHRCQSRAGRPTALRDGRCGLDPSSC